MIVSWKWLQDYVALDLDPAEVAHQLAMAGLNHEGSERVGEDLAIDLEVSGDGKRQVIGTDDIFYHAIGLRFGQTVLNW